VVLHSATKHLGGHGDVTAGAIMLSDEGLADEIAFLQNAEGTALSPFDSWLLLRGMKTLAVRVAQENRNALQLACFLETQSSLRKVHYPGLESHRGHALHARQARGAGQLLSIETGDKQLSRRLCEETELFTVAVSFGSTSSTISMPCHMSHASVPDDAIAAGRVAALPEDLVRVSVGLEDPRDLIADLQNVLQSSVQIREDFKCSVAPSSAASSR
jgi:cystathionine beta-lyase